MAKSNAAVALAANIRNAMAAQNLTQKDLAAKSGVTQPHINRILNVVSEPTVGILEKIAGAFEVPVSYLLLGAAATVPKKAKPPPVDKLQIQMMRAFAGCDESSQRTLIQLARKLRNSKKAAK